VYLLASPIVQTPVLHSRDLIAIGMDYLPPIARRLHHCRELGEAFDFLTWFEYAPEHAEAFEELVRRLRETREWHFVDREVDGGQFCTWIASNWLSHRGNAFRPSSTSISAFVTHSCRAALARRGSGDL